jgi:hypothetical protein
MPAARPSATRLGGQGISAAGNVIPFFSVTSVVRQFLSFSAPPIANLSSLRLPASLYFLLFAVRRKRS